MDHPGSAKADTGRHHRADPTQEQAGRLTECGHSCRAVWNLAPEQRQYLRHHRGLTPRANTQGLQLTRARAELPWLTDPPARSAKEVLRQLDRADDNWRNPQHPAHAPTSSKRSNRLAVPLPGQAVAVRKLNRRWARVRLPRLGWIRSRLSRPPGGTVRNATVSHDGLGGRVLGCTACGHLAHADLNAALVIEWVAAGQAVNSTRGHPRVAGAARGHMREPLGNRVV